MSDTPEEDWYIVKQPSEQCKILSAAEFASMPIAEENTEEEETSSSMKWGPFETQNQAYAKRVGLIRAGKCQPIS